MLRSLPLFPPEVEAVLGAGDAPYDGEEDDDDDDEDEDEDDGDDDDDDERDESDSCRSLLLE